MKTKWTVSFFFKIGFCLSVFGWALYSYLNLQNQLTYLKFQIPQVEKQIRSLEEENARLVYEIERFEDPAHLMELAHHAEYAHLKHPLNQEIVTVFEALATNEPCP